MENGNVAVIRTFNSVTEAQLYKALLESAGIQTRMRNDITAQVLPAYGGMLGVELLVSSEDEQRAKEILAAKFSEEEFDKETDLSKRHKEKVK